jgi:ketosteroid isomerase-like protein
MSENLDLVRSIYADWERGDWSSSADWAAPEIELVSADGPQPGSWTEPAEMAKALRDFLSAWEGLRLEAEEYRELDRARVVVMTRITGHGKISGLDLGDVLGKSGAAVFHVRDGRVAKLTFYWDRDRALADLGVEA